MRVTVSVEVGGYSTGVRSLLLPCGPGVELRLRGCVTSSFYRFLFILCTWMFYLYVFSCNACMPGACAGHKRESSCCSKQLLAAVWCWRLEPDPLEEQLLSHSPTPGAGTCAQLDPVCVFPRTTDTRAPTAWFYVVLQMRPGL